MLRRSTLYISRATRRQLVMSSKNRSVEGNYCINFDELHSQVLCSKLVLNLEACMSSGQTFSWTPYTPPTSSLGKYWLNIIDGVVVILSDDAVPNGSVIYWSSSDAHQKQCKSVLWAYFRLDVDLAALYQDWSLRDAHFANIHAGHPGIRLLDQSPFEGLLSFICSQNNIISRITSMVHTLKRDFHEEGDFAYVLQDPSIKIYNFPSPQALAAPGVTEILREKGFGYRARYVELLSASIVSGEMDLEGLKAMGVNSPNGESYEHVWRKLMTVVGVGPKVADCAALAGFAQTAAVPIDTHILKVAKMHYPNMPESSKALTLNNYRIISEKFKAIFGPQAGWAQLVLFAAQLNTSKTSGNTSSSSEKTKKLKKKSSSEDVNKRKQVKAEPIPSSQKRRKATTG